MLVFNHSKSRCKKLPIILECQNLLIVSKLTYFTVCSQPNNFPGLIIGFEPRPSSAPPRHVFVKISIWVCAQVWERKKMLLTISCSQPVQAYQAGLGMIALPWTTQHPTLHSFSRLALHDRAGGSQERPWSEKKEADEKPAGRKMCSGSRSV